MADKIVKQIQQLIAEKDPKKSLGKIKTSEPKNFTFKDQNRISVPESENRGSRTQAQTRPKNIVWLEFSYQHNRGKFHDFERLDDFFITSQPLIRSLITSENGNFSDINVVGNFNSIYFAMVTARATALVPIQINSSDSSVALFTRAPGESWRRLFSSGNQTFTNSKVFLPLTVGENEIGIVYYREDSNGLIEITGGLGSYVTSFVTWQASSNSFKKNKNRLHATTDISAKSQFVDGRNGPALANIVSVDPTNADLSSTYSCNFYRQNNKQLSFNVVSGWDPNGFVVSGDKVTDFPIAGTCIFDDVTSAGFTISGVRYHDQIDQTIVKVSGTLTVSPLSSNPLWIRDYDQFDSIRKTSSQVISGLDFNVVAGETYSYAVTTTDFVGNESDFSSVVNLIAGDFTPPGQVTGLSATGGNKAIELSWTNPSDPDLKGIHIWDKQNPVSGTDIPVATLLKGTKNTVPNKFIAVQTTSGTLIDDWPYSFYASTFDWAGNEDAVSMPTASATTIVEIKTKRTGQRIETDTSTNQLRFYDSNGNLVVKLGETIFGNGNGLLIQQGLIFLDNEDPNNFGIISQHDIITGGNVSELQPAIQGEVITREDPLAGTSIGVAGVVRNLVGNNTQTNQWGVYGSVNAAATLVPYKTWAGYFDYNVNVEGLLVSNNLTVENNLIVSGLAQLDNGVSLNNSSPYALLDSAGMIRTTGSTSQGSAAGKGLEITYQDDTIGGRLLSFDRDASAYKPSTFDSSIHYFNVSGTRTTTLDSFGIRTSTSTDTFLKLGGRINHIPSTTDAWIINSRGDGSFYPFNQFGNLVLAPRTNADRNVVLMAGNPAKPVVSVTPNNGGTLLVSGTTTDIGARVISVGTMVAASKQENAEFIALSAITGNSTFIQAGRSGSGSFLPIKFLVGSGGSTRMTIDTNGFVGVGSQTPGAQFHVRGSTVQFDADSSQNGRFRFGKITGITADTEAFLHMDNGNNLGFFLRSDGNTPFMGAWDGGSLNFRGFDIANNGTLSSQATLFQVDFGNTRAVISGAMIFRDNVSDPTTGSNTAAVYAKDVAGTVEMFVRDEASNVTQISPHNKQGDWVFFSKNIRTGRVRQINMDKLVSAVEKLTGEKFSQEWYE